MNTIPITIKEANEFIKKYHRHHKPPQGYKFCIGLAEKEKLIGVAILGRPINRFRDDGLTLEITRTCTDGTHNANSMLYGASCRVAFALGYKKVITYTLQSESGVSLRGSGFRIISEVKGRKWTGTYGKKEHLRKNDHPIDDKFCWGKES